MKLSVFALIGLVLVAVIGFVRFQSISHEGDPGNSAAPPAEAAAQTADDTALTTSPIAPKSPPTGDERYTDMAVTIEVTPDADILVTENITAVARQERIVRGITRNIPLVRHHRWFTSASDITVEAATINGQPSPFSTTISGHDANIRIGDPDRELRPGVYTFGLTYKLDRQIGYFDDFDEIYWNVIGTGFDFTTEKASAVVTLPGTAPVRHIAAYTGALGDTSQHGATFSKGADGKVTFDTTRALNPGEAFTVAVSWPKGFLTDPGWLARVIGNPIAIAISLVTLIGTAIYFFIAWWQVGRDPPRGPEVPVYAPTLPPHAMRFLDRSGFDYKCLVAAIMEICAKGHARLEDHPTEKKATVLQPTFPSETPDRRPLSVGEQKVFDVLIGDRTSGLIISRGSSEILARAYDALKDAVEDRFAKGFFEANAGVYAIGAVVILVGMMSSIAWDAGALLLMDIAYALLTAAGVVSAFSLVYTIVAFIVRRVRGRRNIDWYARLMGRIALWTIAVALFSLFVIGPRFVNDVGLLPAILLVLAIVILMVALKILPRRTALGQSTMDEVRGTQLYLSVAEAGRLKFENPPEMTPKHFSNLLPYAVALDVENAWTDRFSAVVGAATLAAPTWYSGNSWPGQTGASSNNPLVAGISSIVGSQRQAIGGISGSGGGGFAGGGGGGGGSGGW